MVSPVVDLGGLAVVADYFGLKGLIRAVRLRQEEVSEEGRRRQLVGERRHREVVTRLDDILGRLAEQQQQQAPGPGPRFPGPEPRFPGPNFPDFHG